MGKIILENFEVVVWILGVIGSFLLFTNKQFIAWMRKPFIKKTDEIKLKTDEISLSTSQLEFMEQYLKLQDEKFIKLLEENKALLKEIEESKAKCKAEMESYKKYMSGVHNYVIRLQKKLTDNNIEFKKYDDNGLF